jgi:hypothetical protein
MILFAARVSAVSSRFGGIALLNMPLHVRRAHVKSREIEAQRDINTQRGDMWSGAE